MSMLNSVAKLAAKPFPRTVSSKGHSIVNYVVAGSFLAAAGLFWRRNKRAAVASLICGATDLALTALTDSPAGMNRVINFRTRREIDAGLAAMFATMPQFLAFNDEKEKGFFLLQGAVMTGLAEVTRFPEHPQRPEKRHPHAEAA
ncbi:hypothetical protein [Occallatibacter riparius]|uniref:Uncharacterized protein n=1 Tax=Occallatibacter riparius TaxID=1002689 RepID=A0A9J7BVI2_9BACT|nr:hypothetical protein [Occallatibacter riparius]UWZ86883.1 hypothetical protein MOP44_13255 [Occallatibacter riparius]